MRTSFDRQLSWLVPVGATVTAAVLIAVQGFVQDPIMRVLILGMPAACFVTALVGWGIRRRGQVAPSQSWTQDSFDGKTEVTFTLTCRGPAAAIPSTPPLRKDYARRMGWITAYGRRVMAVTDDINPPENAPQLLAQAESAQKQAEAIEEANNKLRLELVSRDERITKLEGTLDEVLSRAARPAPAPQPQPSAERRQERRREEPRERKPRPEKRRDKEVSLPGSDNIGQCELCEDKRERRRFKVVNCRRTPDSEPETLNVCVGSCSTIAQKLMGGKIVSAKDAGTRKQDQAAPEEAVESS